MRAGMLAKILLILCLQQDRSVQAILENPFDLQQFKKVKRGSNSGIASPEKYFFKPSEEGRYFYFFLFPAPGAFVYSADGDRKQAVRSGTGFQIVTFKPNGKFQDVYLDPTESLIEVTAAYNDPDLPGLAFVGLDSAFVKEKLGSVFIRRKDCFIYSHGINTLVLNFSGGVVKCLKYSRLNEGIKRHKIPDGLTEMKCSNQPAR